MTETVRQILTRAARKIGQATEGQPAPVPWDMDGLLEILQAWYESSMNGGLFGQLVDVFKDEAYTAAEFDRVRKDAAVTITLPDTITDADTGEERAPLDLCPIVVTYPGQADYPQLNVYDADVGDWVRLDGLTLDSVAPLSGRGANGLAAIVAALKIEDHGLEPGRVMTSQALGFRMNIASRHGSVRRAVDYEYF